MNCFSTFSGMRETSNIVNSLTNRYTKPLTFDFSGTNYTDLSATTSYAISAAGLSSNSFAIVKHNNRPLVVSDFSSGSFTFYLKHASNTSPLLLPFNFLNPNLVKVSSSFTSVGQDFTSSFYSFLSPGSIIPYSITGCVSSDLSNAPLNGTFTAPYQEITYRVTTAPSSNLIFFNVSGGPSTSLTLASSQIEYVVTVIDGKYAINGVKLDKIIFLPSNRYVFTQTDGNFGTYPIQFSRTPNGPASIGVSDTQWSLSVEGTTTTLFLNSSFTGNLYYFSTAVQNMGYMPPSITVSTPSSVVNQIGRDVAFEFTIFNNTSSAVLFSISSSVTTGDFMLDAGQLYIGASITAYNSLLNQSVPIGTTTVLCKNRALAYQTITCTVDNGDFKAAVLAGPPPTIFVSRSSTAIDQISQDSSFNFRIVNNTSADVSFSMTSSVTTGDYILAANQLYDYDSTSRDYGLNYPVLSGQTIIVYCKNKALIYQTVTCTVDNAAYQTAVLAGPPPRITVSKASDVGNQIGQDSSFNFTIVNNTSAAVLFSMLSTAPTGNYELTTDQLFIGLSRTRYDSLLNQSVSTGITIVDCMNQTLTYQTVTCTILNAVSGTAVLAGPPPTITVSQPTVFYNSDFSFNIANTTGPNYITYSLTSSPTVLTVTDISLANATPLTNVEVETGVSRTISCRNRTSQAKTVSMTSTTYSASTFLYGPPSLAVSISSEIPHGSSFTFTVNNTTATAITYSLSSIPALVYTDISLASAFELTDVSVAAGETREIICWNNTDAAKTVVLSSANLESKNAILKGPPSLAVDTSTEILQGSSFYFTVNNTTAAAITYSLSSSPTLVYSDISLASALDLSNEVASGVTKTITCWNKTGTAKTVVLSSANLESKNAILKGPPSLAVSPASRILQGSSFYFTLNNTSVAAITYNLSSTPTLVYTDISLASALDLSNEVASGVTKTITCWNKTGIEKTITLRSRVNNTDISASASLYGPPSVTVSPAGDISQNSSFTFTVRNTTADTIRYTISGSTLPSYVLANTQLGLTSLSGEALADQRTDISCINTVSIYQPLKCTLSSNNTVAQTNLIGPLPTITFSTASPVTYGSSFTISILNTYASSITALLSTGGSAATTKSDLSLNSDTLTVPLYTGVNYSINCTNKVTANKKVTCTISGSTRTGDLSLNAAVVTIAPNAYYNVSNPTPRVSSYQNNMRIVMPTTTFTNTSFTIECYVYFNEAIADTYDSFLQMFGTSQTTNDGVISMGYWYRDKQLDVHVGNIYQFNTTNSTVIGTGSWHHVACVYTYDIQLASRKCDYYVNGVNKLTCSSLTNNDQTLLNGVSTLYFPAYNNACNGRYKNIRISTSAVYTAGFTPDANQNLTALASTKYLMRINSDNTIVNAGTNSSITTTANGTITIVNPG